MPTAILAAGTRTEAIGTASEPARPRPADAGATRRIRMAEKDEDAQKQEKKAGNRKGVYTWP